MADTRFFKKNREAFSVTELAELTKSSVIGDENLRVFDVSTLTSAKEGELSFFSNPKYKTDFINTKASACVCDEAAAAYAPKNAALIINPNPYFAYAIITSAFYHAQPTNGIISKNAIIDGSATIGENVTVSDFSVIGKNVKVGKNSFIGANTVVCDGVEIGENTKIMHNVTISHALIGEHCVIFSGARIGQDGFGYAPSSNGIIKVEQLGRVIIKNHVEVGANTTIDRGAIDDTIIEDHTKIDNLVQLGHNVHIGKGCFLAAQTGIAGSTVVGDRVMFGGQAGIIGHIAIGDGAIVAAQSGVIADVAAGTTVGGSPALPIRQWHRITAMLKKMTTK